MQVLSRLPFRFTVKMSVAIELVEDMIVSAFVEAKPPTVAAAAENTAGVSEPAPPSKCRLS